jgi:hypothetical protein
VLPSLTVGGLFDDNINSTSSRQQSDFITRFIPAVALGFTSRQLNLQLGGSSSADIYAEHSENSQVFSSQQASLASSYLLTPQATLGLSADYTRTESDTQIVNEFGVRVGTGTAQTYSVSPSLAYHFTPATAGNLGYRFEYNDLSVGPSNQSHEATMGVSHHLTAVDVGRLYYTVEVAESSAADTVTSNVVTVGWSRQWGANTSTSIQLGPRFTGDETRLEVAAGLAHRFKYGTAWASYVRTQSIATGQAGIQDVDSVAAAFAFVPLWGGYRVTVTGTFTNIGPSSAAGGQTGDTRTYFAAAEVSRQITSWLAVRAYYQFTYSDGSGGSFTRNVVGAELGVSRLFPIK